MTELLGSIQPIFLENGVLLPDSADFDLGQTLECGQAFRWEKQPDGSFLGVAYQKVCQIAQTGSGILLKGATRADFEAVWRDYFDLDRDYGALKRELSAHPVFARAVAYAPGIRLLRQEPWEALCSFIISQNNNIPRIKGIIARLCQLLGRPLTNGLYAFPDAQTLAGCTLAQLEPLRAGFRARYLLDAAQKIACGQVDLQSLHSLPMMQAQAALMQITGVGKKVAACTLLYGCGRLECFPVDVWIGRAMKQLLPEGLPDYAQQYAGIAQQYLFHYARTCTGLCEPDAPAVKGC